MNVSKIEKLTYYYELKVDFAPGFTSNRNLFPELFARITACVNAKEAVRYVQVGDKLIFINEIAFNGATRVIKGKLLSIRMDLFPELHNTASDITRAIEAEDEDGIVETTHFVIDYSRKNKKFLSLEWSHSGAKYWDFVAYLHELGSKKGWTTNVYVIPYIRDSLKETKARINNASEIVMKVSKSNIDGLKKIDSGLFSSMTAIRNHFDQDYIEMRLKFDYKSVNAGTNSKRIQSIINKLITNKKNLDVFDSLKVSAEDSERQNRLSIFDLLVDKFKSVMKVERRHKSRTILSSDMFSQMEEELIKNKKKLS
jgi:hypothetical protein